MSQPRYSRQLSSRVEIEFHRHPNRFRRWTWWTALACSMIAVVWLVQAGVRGEKRLYEAGPVTTPHRMFENDCWRCHTDNLAPLARLTSLSDHVRSVKNEKCIECHIGPEHHANQVPVHGNGANELSCAKCHREHAGHEELARVADRHCTDCHNDLQTVPGPRTFAKSVNHWESAEGHPNFKIEDLINGKVDPDVEIALKRNGEPVHHAFSVVGYLQRPGEEPRWQDQARIRFNHAAHMKAMFNADGSRIKGERVDEIGVGRDGELIGYPTSCVQCHEFDVERRYMKPINYESHCKSCHPLTFDVDKFALAPDGQKLPITVPHETPDVVRGYLAKVYSLDAPEKAADPNAINPDPLAELRRGFPGRDFEANLTKDRAKKLFVKLKEEEQKLYPLDYLQNEMARRDSQKVLFKENGACALCHDIRKYDTKELALKGKPKSSEPWAIVPPKIPQRWYKHSWFRHDSHRMVSCVECHIDLKTGEPVYKSASTGDVLMPNRQNCMKCHRTGAVEQTGQGGDSHLLGARADCVECHGYHDYSKEDFDGNLNLDLTPRPDKSSSIPTGHGSK